MTKKWNRADFQAKNDHRYLTVAGGRCVYCLKKAVLLDHVPALYDVFKNGVEPECKVPSCYECNQQIGAFECVEPYQRIMKATGLDKNLVGMYISMSSLWFPNIQQWAEFVRDMPADVDQFGSELGYLSQQAFRVLSNFVDSGIVVPVRDGGRLHLLQDLEQK